MTAPSAGVSSTIRALSSRENRRRRPSDHFNASHLRLRLKLMVKRRHKPISISEIANVADKTRKKKVRWRQRLRRIGSFPVTSPPAKPLIISSTQAMREIDRNLL